MGNSYSRFSCFKSATIRKLLCDLDDKVHALETANNDSRSAAETLAKIKDLAVGDAVCQERTPVRSDEC